MPVEIISILSQLPVVLVFIWYSERIVGNFQKFLMEERQARERSMELLREEVRAVRSDVEQFEGKFDTAVARMDERSKQREATQPTQSKPRLKAT